MRRWRDFISERSRLDAGEYIDRFVGATDFVTATERWAPHLLEEIRGMGEGAGISFREIYAYNMVDEEWLFARDLSLEPQAVAAEHCTCVGVFDRPDEPPLLAQNMDVPKFYDGSQALLHIKHADSDLESFVFTLAGVLIANGLNSAGIGVCCNTVAQLAHSNTGLPVSVVARRILEHRTLGDAVDFVKGAQHASGQNYMIGGPDGIVSLECSAHAVAEYAPMPGRVYHTNHPLASDDVDPQPGAGPRSAPDPITGSHRSNSEIRCDAAAAALADPAERIAVERIEAVLSDPETLVCVLRDAPVPSFTAGSMVMELSAPPVLHLAPGPGAVTEYRRWTFA
jgi:hypothetical protein